MKEETEKILEQNRAIKITKEAYCKGNYLAKRATELAGEGIELFMYALDFKDSAEPVIRDLYVARNQEVTCTSCKDRGIS